MSQQYSQGGCDIGQRIGDEVKILQIDVQGMGLFDDTSWTREAAEYQFYPNRAPRWDSGQDLKCPEITG